MAEATRNVAAVAVIEEVLRRVSVMRRELALIDSQLAYMHELCGEQRLGNLALLMGSIVESEKELRRRPG